MSWLQSVLRLTRISFGDWSTSHLIFAKLKSYLTSPRVWLEKISGVWKNCGVQGRSSLNSGKDGNFEYSRILDVRDCIREILILVSRLKKWLSLTFDLDWSEPLGIVSNHKRAFFGTPYSCLHFVPSFPFPFSFSLYCTTCVVWKYLQSYKSIT